jgi:2,4-dienoyl-CoA reductase-like NADH-dependent reductase (Old Yellow Enzyme family)
MHINRTVERFLREHDIPATKFGRMAARDPRLVLDMRMGRELGSAMTQRLMDFMGNYDRRGEQP